MPDIFGVVFGGPADARDAGLERLVDLAFRGERIEIIVISNAGQIAVFFPHCIHIYSLLVVRELLILFVFCKYERFVQHEEQQNDYNGNGDHNGNAAPQQSNEKILQHGSLPFCYGRMDDVWPSILPVLYNLKASDIKRYHQRPIFGVKDPSP